MNKPNSKTSRAVALTLAFSLSLLAPAAASAGGASGGWERLRTEDGIVVSRKEIPGSKFVAFRGEGDVQAPLLAVASVLVDVPHEKDWIDSVVEARVLREVSPTEYIMYSHVGTPPTMSDRDFVTDVTLTTDAPTRSVTVRMRSITDPAGPATKFVRAELEDSVFVLSSVDGGRHTHVTAEIHCDPKGSVAAWLVNWFQKNWGYNTVASLRKQVARAGGKEDSRLVVLLKDRGVL
jgi:hypothetical protein